MEAPARAHRKGRSRNRAVVGDPVLDRRTVGRHQVEVEPLVLREVGTEDDLCAIGGEVEISDIRVRHHDAGDQRRGLGRRSRDRHRPGAERLVRHLVGDVGDARRVGRDRDARLDIALGDERRIQAHHGAGGARDRHTPELELLVDQLVGPQDEIRPVGRDLERVQGASFDEAPGEGERRVRRAGERHAPQLVGALSHRRVAGQGVDEQAGADCACVRQASRGRRFEQEEARLRRTVERHRPDARDARWSG